MKDFDTGAVIDTGGMDNLRIDKKVKAQVAPLRDVAKIAEGAREITRMFSVQQKLLSAMATMIHMGVSFDSDTANKVVDDIEHDIIACNQAYK